MGRRVRLGSGERVSHSDTFTKSRSALTFSRLLQREKSAVVRTTDAIPAQSRNSHIISSDRSWSEYVVLPPTLCSCTRAHGTFSTTDGPDGPPGAQGTLFVVVMLSMQCTHGLLIVLPVL